MEQGIVFYITGSVNLHDVNSGTIQTPAPVSVFSHQTDKKRFQVSSEFCMFTIFLHAGIMYRLMGMPMADLNQSYHDAEFFFGTEVRMVTESVGLKDSQRSLLPTSMRILVSIVLT